MTELSLAIIDRLPIEVIENFRRTGKSKSIPVQIQKYICELDKVAEITNVEFEHNISRIAKRLIYFYPEMSFNTARNRVYDAFNYFHLNSGIKAAAWDNYYADRMEDAAKYAMSADNLTEYRRYMEKAREYRKEAAKNTVDPDEFKPHIILVSPDVDAERLGIKELNLKTLWTETKKFVNGLPIDSKNKKEAIQDASDSLGITAEDVEYEDL